MRDIVQRTAMVTNPLPDQSRDAAPGPGHSDSRSASAARVKVSIGSVSTIPTLQ